MANYLPILLHSVGSNAVPDDSSLTTLPRGQVDYLSHDWEEEDVWRSWRNMTRQKNEIANGVRLENASWRTWWKQRNNLKTVSPETLNWLKDSDVTWLYGPLHTAVEWTPPPKPKPDETEHKMASAHDRLDLSEAKHKSILKYRSISEMLTSELPNSPIFSPHESDEEGNVDSSQDVSDASSSSNTRRPSLSQTKSDTHLTRWGPNRVFRKDSPPRVEPPGGTGQTTSSTGPSSSASHVHSGTDLSGYFASHVQGQKSSSSSPSPKPTSTEPTPTGGLHHSGSQKKRHITFNTFVEQCIAIDKPKPKETTFQSVPSEDEGDDEPGRAGYDDGYDEDGEDGFDGDWGLNECAIGTDSESDVDQDVLNREEDDEDEEEEGVIQMKTRRDSFNSKNNASCLRSTSKASNSSSSSSGESYSSSSTSAPSSSYSSSSARRSGPLNIRRRKRGDGPNHITLPRQDSSSTLVRNNSSTALSALEKEQQQMVSIAPIAPTMLKTGGQASWDGFGVQSPYSQSHSGAWMEGFGDEGFSDDGGQMRAGPGGANLYFGNNNNSSDSESGTPVGLVYMPPSTYGGALVSRGNSSTSLSSEAEIELREDVNQKEADDVKQSAEETPENGDKAYHHHEAYFSTDKEGVLGARSVPPIVVRTPPAVEHAHGSLNGDAGEEEAAYEHFNGPDLGEDFALHKPRSSPSPRSQKSGSDSASTSVQDEPKAPAPDEERKSRSRSRSRTPSPSAVPQSTTPAISVPGRSDRNVSSPPPSSASLLSPPQRGRGVASPESPTTSRGRSTTSTSFSERSRSRSSHSSPLGSLSPDGIGSSYGAYANGRGGGDRERERERSTRSGGRGRERTERKLSHSLSPDAVGNVPSVGSDVASNASSSSSSTSQIALPTSNYGVSERSTSPVNIPADEDLRSSPTPANSPVISMGGAAHAIARMNSKPPIHIPDPQVSSPLLSYSSASSNDASIVKTPSPTHSPSSPRGRAPSDYSIRSKTEDEDDGTIVGKAVGMVSSAGAYFGLWNNGNPA